MCRTRLVGRYTILSLVQKKKTKRSDCNRISRSLGETIQILSEIKTRDFGFVFGELDLFSEKVVICFRIICNLFLENQTFPPALPHVLK